MKNANLLTRTTLAASLVAAVLTVSSFSASAAPFADFTVDESSVPASTGGTFEADKINGSYAERITFDNGDFSASAFADFHAYLSDEGITPVLTSQLDKDYALYAIFSATGTVAVDPVTGIVTFIGSDAQFDLFIDPDQDTTKELGDTGSDPVTLENDDDDYLIAFANSLESGVGILVPGVGGFFDFVFDDFTLTIDGVTYFIDPSPFYTRVNVDGDFDDFTPTGTQTVTGDVSAVFQAVPEPGSIALLGLGLLGLAFGLRRQRLL